MVIILWKVDRFGSRPARGAWIEITGGEATHTLTVVAPRKGRVD